MLKIYYAPLNSISSDEVLGLLKNRNKKETHIIITPDRANLNFEKKLFSVTGESSFFDVSVTTLSRFCNSVISRYGQDKKVLSKMSGVAIVKKILVENKKDLKVFKRNVEFRNFAEDIFNLICMFKSNNVTPKQVVNENTSPELERKLHDLNLVYEKYEEFLTTDFTDSFNRLNLCKELINVGDFKNTNVYLLNFDDFTKQGYSIIEKLLKCAKNVYISTTFAKRSENKKNSNLYLNNVYYTMIDIAQKQNIEWEVVECKSGADNEKEHLLNNVFAPRPNEYKGQVSSVKIKEYLTFEDEFKGVVSEIKLKVMAGERYKNFAILVPDLASKHKMIKDEFEKYNVPHFMDVNSSMVDDVVSRFLLNVVSMKCRINKFDVLNILKSPFCDVDRSEIAEYENYVTKFGIVDGMLLKTNFEDVNVYFAKFSDFLTKKHKNVNDYVDSLVDLLQKVSFEEKLDVLAKYYYDDGEILEYKKLNSVINKVSKIIAEMKNVLNGVDCTAKTFYEMFLSFLETSNIVMPPILSDSVFVGDVSSSYVDKFDYLYLLNVNEGQILVSSSDDGIITDSEIDSMKEDVRVNPTVKFVNKKSKFKLFELLFSYNKNLQFSYHVKNGGSECFAAAFLLDLAHFMNIKIENSSLEFNEIENNYYCVNEQSILKNNFCKSVSEENFITNLRLYNGFRGNPNYVKMLSTVADSLSENRVFENLMFKNIYNGLEDNNFFVSGKTSVSEFENYFRCPYMHFVNYSLKLNDEESEEVKAFEVGNIIHEFLKLVVPLLMDEEVDISKIVDEKLHQILNQKEYESLVANKSNNFLIKDLFSECERICKVVKHTNKYSSFKPFAFEKPFADDDLLDININGEKVKLVGVIDRVDKCDDKFVVIDYKTGSSSFSDFTDVFYGKKLQLIVYMMTLFDKNTYVPAGAFYLPISNGFSKNDGKDLYKMKGIINKDNADFTLFDNRLTQNSFNSDIVNVGTDKSGKIKQNNNFYKNLCLTNDDFLKLTDYVKEVLNRATEEILKGNISPNPLSDGNKKECDYCKYKGMCNFNLWYGNNCTAMKKVATVKELVGEGEDE